MTATAMLTGAVAAGSAATLASGWIKGLIETTPRWLDFRPHIAVGALGGAGAAAVAGSWTEAVAFVVLAVALALLFVVDLADHRLPDAIVLPTYPILFALLLIAAAAGSGWGLLGRALAAGGVLLVVYFAIAFAYPPGMGLGDVKLAGLLGLFLGWLGWPEVLLGTVAAFVINALFALALLLARRVGRKGEVPFGPAMIIGAGVGAAWGPYVFTGMS